MAADRELRDEAPAVRTTGARNEYTHLESPFLRVTKWTRQVSSP
jgi:hypothetical protein